MKQLVLEKIVVSPFPPMNKRCLWIKGNTFNYWYNGAWRSIDTEIDIDEEYINEKVNESVSTEKTKLVGDAPQEYDSIEEIAQHIVDHKEETEEISENINANTESIKKLEEQIAAGGSGMPSEWEGFEI